LDVNAGVRELRHGDGGEFLSRLHNVLRYKLDDVTNNI
jgi:hypothetical protein